MWHVSVSLQPTLPVREWSPEQRMAAEGKCLDMLAGVGDVDAYHWQQGTLALHYRRAMTAAEALALPPPVRTSPEYNQRVRALRVALVAAGVLDPSEYRDLPADPR